MLIIMMVSLYCFIFNYNNGSYNISYNVNMMQGESLPSICVR